MTDAKRIAKKLFSYKNKPYEFVVDILRATPIEWQRDILNQVGTGANISISSCNGAGKSEVMSWIILYYLVVHPNAVVVCTAPTEKQLNTVLWGKLWRYIQQSKIKDLFSFTDTKVGIAGFEKTWYAIAKTASQPEALQGFHSKYVLMCIDESSGVSDAIFEAITGGLTQEGAQIVMISNPTRLSGFFYDSQNKNKHLWYTKQVSALDIPEHIISRSWIQLQKDQFGEDSNSYKIRVLGQFPDSEADGLISREWIAQSNIRYNNEEHYAQDCVELGVDCARFGDDRTVLALRIGSKLVQLDTYEKIESTQVAANAIELCHNYGVEAVKIDVGNIGGAVIDIIRANEYIQTHNIEIVEVGFGETSPDPYYANKASFMWGTLKERLRLGQIELPENEELTTELSGRRYNVDDKSRVIIEKKSDFKKRGNRSCDLADAVVLAYADLSTGWNGEIIML